MICNNSKIAVLSIPDTVIFVLEIEYYLKSLVPKLDLSIFLILRKTHLFNRDAWKMPFICILH